MFVETLGNGLIGSAQPQNVLRSMYFLTFGLGKLGTTLAKDIQGTLEFGDIFAAGATWLRLTRILI